MEGLKKPEEVEDWTDYTRYALGMEDYGPDKEIEPPALYDIVDRKRALGVDFGPQFVGLALSLGGVNTLPVGTLKTGEDWKETALKIAEIASNRRAKEIVMGLPLETDGSEGKIAKFVRYFSHLLADSTLLLLGLNCSVYLWDERFSTAYAAVRMVLKPRLDSGPFKNWLDGQRGLSVNYKSLLDAEAARSILEHWLEGDPVSGNLNKEKSEKVPPSREACHAFLRWRKGTRGMPARPPSRPAGPGKEAWEWYDRNTGTPDQDSFLRGREASDKAWREGMDQWGNKEKERAELDKAREEETEKEERIRRLKDDSGLKKHFREQLQGQKSASQADKFRGNMDMWRRRQR